MKNRSIQFLWGLLAVEVMAGPVGAAELVAKENGDLNGDTRIDISDVVYLLDNLFLGGPPPVPVEAPPAGPALPATGQSKCYGLVRNQVWGVVQCEESAACPGQDATSAIGCPLEGRFVDNQDGTVTDNCTGLMWQKDTADVNGDGSSNDSDVLPWCDALAYCEGLAFAGHDDWRLPNVRELQSIVDYGRFEPSIDPVFSAIGQSYWSSTTIESDLADGEIPASAWDVSFGAGGVGNEVQKHYANCVRAVRNAR